MQNVQVVLGMARDRMKYLTRRRTGMSSWDGKDSACPRRIPWRTHHRECDPRCTWHNKILGIQISRERHKNEKQDNKLDEIGGSLRNELTRHVSLTSKRFNQFSSLRDRMHRGIDRRQRRERMRKREFRPCIEGPGIGAAYRNPKGVVGKDPRSIEDWGLSAKLDRCLIS